MKYGNKPTVKRYRSQRTRPGRDIKVATVERREVTKRKVRQVRKGVA